MIRTDVNISEEDYAKISKPFSEELTRYVKDNFIDDYVAFYIAMGYKMDVLFAGSLSGIFNAALDSLCSLQFGSDEDIKKLKAILKDK